MGRVMGLDVGEKRIGVALSDPLMLTAQGIESYTRRTEAQDIQYLKDLMAEKDVDTLVVGLPMNMNGTLGPQAEYTQAFAEKLSTAANVPLEYFDERLSSAAANRTLLEADVSRKKRRKVVDKLAAVNILQGYMDTKSSAGLGGLTSGRLL